MSASVASVKMKHVHFEQVEANLKGQPKLCACIHWMEKVQLYMLLSGEGSSINIIVKFNDLICDNCWLICSNHPHYIDFVAQSLLCTYCDGDYSHASSVPVPESLTQTDSQMTM